MEPDTKTFHCFSRLPTELQWKIWETAVQPPPTHQRGAHFLSTWKPPKPKPKSWSIAARRKVDAPLIASRLDNRESAYQIDGGLWTACRQSRDRIQWVYKKQRQLCPLQRSGAHLASNGDDWTFTHFPNRDLVCFQGKDLRNILHWFANRSAMPSFFNNRIINFALEYDERWDELFPRGLPKAPYNKRKTMDGIIFRACSKARAENIWLIDRAPRLLPGKASTAEFLHLFHGNGKNFASMDFDSDWDLMKSRSFKFAIRLGRALAYWEYFTRMNNMAQDYVLPIPRIRVLCCIE
ncbi:hypothetical protein V8C42DRAFT_356949 [Trichoderma barbatum]